jgi:hypothetical protein
MWSYVEVMVLHERASLLTNNADMRHFSGLYEPEHIRLEARFFEPNQVPRV